MQQQIKVEETPLVSEGVKIGSSARGSAGYDSSPESASRIICTYFYCKGLLSEEIWRADMEFTRKNAPRAGIRGYHVWSAYYIRLMRKYPMFEKFIFTLAKWRAQELAYQMGVLPKGSLRGKLLRLVGEPICYIIGLFAGKK